MSLLKQTYALVTQEGFERALSSRWPDAPAVGDYRLLVFTDKELPTLEEEFYAAEFKYFEPAETIAAMEAGDVGPFICSLQQARDVVNHFNPVVTEEV